MANRVFMKFKNFTRYSRIKCKMSLFCYLHTHKGTTEQFEL